MAKKKKVYNVLSPDGVRIHHENTYSSKKKAYEAFKEWRKNYVTQGYYSSVRYGKITLKELANYCRLIKE